MTAVPLTVALAWPGLAALSPFMAASSAFAGESTADRSTTEPPAELSWPTKIGTDDGVVVRVGSGSNTVGTDAAPSTVPTLAKQSDREDAPVLVRPPLPPQAADDMATVRLVNDDDDSPLRSKELPAPGSPARVTPLAVPGWKVVSRVDPAIWTTG